MELLKYINSAPMVYYNYLSITRLKSSTITLMPFIFKFCTFHFFSPLSFPPQIISYPNEKNSVMPTPTNRKKTQETKRHQNREAVFQQRVEHVPEFVWPITILGYFKTLIYLVVRFAQDHGISDSTAFRFLAKHLQKSYSTVATYFREMRSNSSQGISPDRIINPDPESVLFSLVSDVLAGYLNEDGFVVTNPTNDEHIATVQLAITEYNKEQQTMIGDDYRPLTASHGTIMQYTYDLKWKFKTKKNIPKATEAETMVKRVNFSKAVLEYMDDSGIEILWGDEMAFYYNTGLSKKLAPVGQHAFSKAPLTIKVPAINIITYMTKHNIIHMGLSYKTTKREDFKVNLVQALKNAHLQIPKNKTILIIVDNAPPHSLDLAQKAISEVKEFLKQSPHETIPRNFKIHKTSPTSPDLNLVEFFNRYFKCNIRRGIHYFDFFSELVEYKGRGRPRKKPVEEDPAPRIVQPLVQKVNVENLFAFLFLMVDVIQQKTRGYNGWTRAENHVRKWATALIQTQGNYDLASQLVHGEYKDMQFKCQDTGRVYDVQKKAMTSIRLMDETFLSQFNPSPISFNDGEFTLADVIVYRNLIKENPQNTWHALGLKNRLDDGTQIISLFSNQSEDDDADDNVDEVLNDSDEEPVQPKKRAKPNPNATNEKKVVVKQSRRHSSRLNE